MSINASDQHMSDNLLIGKITASPWCKQVFRNFGCAKQYAKHCNLGKFQEFSFPYQILPLPIFPDENDTNLCKVDCMSEPSGKQANPEDEDVSKEVKADCQPALD